MANKIFVSLLLTLLYLAKKSEAEGYWANDLMLGGICDLNNVLSESDASAEGGFLETQHRWYTFSGNKQTIGCIKVQNLWHDGTGGYVYSVPSSGGIGEDFVTFHFKSQESRGFHFVVTLYKGVETSANLTQALTKNP